MNVELTLIRINKAVRAAGAASNPLFKQYWNGVADDLRAKLSKVIN